MFRLTLLFAILRVHIAFQQSRPSCICWDKYEVRNITNGEGSECVGITFRTQGLTHACNEPKSPKCVCNESAVGDFQNDKGAWCFNYKPVLQYKQWPCENEEEWNEYRRNYEAFKTRFVTAEAK